MYPFWSPDSHSIAFAARGKLKRADVNGGPAVNICDVNDPRPGSWNKDGVIIFAPNWREPLYRVSAAGGTPVRLTEFDKSRSETTHRHPWFLPDGDHFLYLAGTHLADRNSDLNAIYAGSLSSKERKLILRARSNVMYVGGYLLFVRDTFLLAQPFDPKKLELSGEPLRIADNVRYDAGFFRGIFGASDDGTVIYASGGGSGRAALTLFDRTGKESAVIGSDNYIADPRVSPDGTRLAVDIGDTADLWIYDLQRGGRTRVTSDPLNDTTAIWSPDGKAIAFSSDRTAPPELYVKPSDGSANETQLFHSEEIKGASDWSRDGRFLAFGSSSRSNMEHFAIWMLPMTGEKKAFPFISNAFDNRHPMFSPDGKWVAFISDESGRRELNVTSFPTPGAHQQVSVTGVTSAGFWTSDGNEILYLGADDSLMSVRIKPGPRFDFETARPIAKLPHVHNDGFAAFPDGRKVVAVVPEQAPASAVTIVTSALPKRD